MYHGIPQAATSCFCRFSIYAAASYPDKAFRRPINKTINNNKIKAPRSIDRAIILRNKSIYGPQQQSTQAKMKGFRLFSLKTLSHTSTSRQTASRSLAGQGMMCSNPEGMLEVSDTIARMRIWKHGCGDRRCRAAKPPARTPTCTHRERETETHTHTHYPHTHTQSRPTKPFGAAASSVPKRQDRVTSVLLFKHTLPRLPLHPPPHHCANFDAVLPLCWVCR